MSAQNQRRQSSRLNPPPASPAPSPENITTSKTSEARRQRARGSQRQSKEQKVDEICRFMRNRDITLREFILVYTTTQGSGGYGERPATRTKRLAEAIYGLHSQSRKHSAHFCISRRESMKITVFGIFSSVGNPFVIASCRTKKRLVNLFVVRGSMVSTINLISGLSIEVRKNSQLVWKPVIFLAVSNVTLSKVAEQPNQGIRGPNLRRRRESCPYCGRIPLPHNATKWSSSTATTETRFLKDGLLATDRNQPAAISGPMMR